MKKGIFPCNVRLYHWPKRWLVRPQEYYEVTLSAKTDELESAVRFHDLLSDFIKPLQVTPKKK